ncbi:DUF6519 domain-containing protein [Streptomyces chartreusis]
MQGDFSRLTFDPARHYSAVLLQQGRVQLDADANEQSALVNHFLRRLAADLIGPYGGVGDAFKIAHVGSAGATKDLRIGAGRYYVDGVPADNDRADLTYQGQAGHAPALPKTYPFLVYLRVHERLVTHVEDRGLREVALGDNAPDTAVRLQLVWQVLVTDTIPGSGKALPDNAADILANWRDWQAGWRSTARMAVDVLVPATGQHPCPVAPESRYRGVENQLYRVEIHQGGTAGEATYSWSRDNGSVVFPLPPQGSTRIVLNSLGRDDTLTLSPGDWVEPVDASRLWSGPHDLLEVLKVSVTDREIELSGPVNVSGDHPYLRRWDQRGPARPVAEGPWLPLEDGIQIRFAPGGRYRSGDYWLVPARTATGDVEWPRDGQEPAYRAPHGIDDHIAPLALVKADGTTEDLRSVIQPSAERP